MKISELVNELGNTGLQGEDENKILKLNEGIYYDSSTEFLKDWEINNNDAQDKVGMNLCVYYSIREHENEDNDTDEKGELLKAYFGEFLILHQRRGELTSISVNLIREEDTNRMYSYLKKHWVRNIRYWRSID